MNKRKIITALVLSTLIATTGANTALSAIAPPADTAVVVEAKKKPVIADVKKSYKKKKGKLQISFTGKNHKKWIIIDEDEPFYRRFNGTGTHTWTMYDSTMKKGDVYHFTIAALGKDYAFLTSKRVTIKIK